MSGKNLLYTLFSMSVLYLVLACEPAVHSDNSSERLHSFFDEAWEFQLQENPLLATRVGVHDYNDRLPVETIDAYANRLEQKQQFLQQLEQIDYERLPREDQISYDIFERLTLDRIEEYEFQSYLVPITNRSGFHISFAQLGDQVPLDTVEDYENYIARLNRFEEYAGQHIGLMRAGIERGWVLPEPSLEGFEESIRPHIVEQPEESRLYEPFESFPQRISEADRERLAGAGREAIMNSVVPGHHHQIALQQELDLPDFRRFAGFTVFTEGWGLYAERLGLEAGFYEDPYSNFGRLSYEMWRALRLVVDTGMHYLGWTRQESIDFMAENSALTLHNIRAEVDRYISWPGQALAYKTGELKIRELREKADSELGEDFDIRTFHDAVLLSGAVPLDVLEENIERYIEEQS